MLLRPQTCRAGAEKPCSYAEFISSSTSLLASQVTCDAYRLSAVGVVDYASAHGLVTRQVLAIRLIGAGRATIPGALRHALYDDGTSDKVSV